MGQPVRRTKPSCDVFFSPVGRTYRENMQAMAVSERFFINVFGPGFDSPQLQKYTLISIFLEMRRTAYMAYIYVITNQKNGKQYVGKTGYSLKARFGQHVRDSRKATKQHRPLYAAMNKYGSDIFTIELLEECPYIDSADRERFWIDKLDTYKSGYNATAGGDGTFLYDYKVITDKYKELQNVHDTAKFFNCSREVVRAACAEYNVPTILNKGPQQQRRKIHQINPETGNVISTYESICEAAKEALGDIKYNKVISHGCKTGKVVHGFLWKYIETD